MANQARARLICRQSHQALRAPAKLGHQTERERDRESKHLCLGEFTGSSNFCN